MIDSEAAVRRCFAKKAFIKIHTIHSKTLVSECDRLRHMCCSLIFSNFLRTPFL